MKLGHLLAAIAAIIIISAASDTAKAQLGGTPLYEWGSQSTFDYPQTPWQAEYIQWVKDYHHLEGYPWDWYLPANPYNPITAADKTTHFLTFDKYLKAFQGGWNITTPVEEVRLRIATTPIDLEDVNGTWVEKNGDIADTSWYVNEQDGMESNFKVAISLMPANAPGAFYWARVDGYRFTQGSGGVFRTRTVPGKWIRFYIAHRNWANQTWPLVNSITETTVLCGSDDYIHGGTGNIADSLVEPYVINMDNALPPFSLVIPGEPTITVPSYEAEVNTYRFYAEVPALFGADAYEILDPGPTMYTFGHNLHWGGYAFEEYGWCLSPVAPTHHINCMD